MIKRYRYFRNFHGRLASLLLAPSQPAFALIVFAGWCILLLIAGYVVQ